MRTKALLALLSVALYLPMMAQEHPANERKTGCHTTLPESMKFSLDTAKGRGLADNYYLWDIGKELHVKFLSGSKAMQQKVVNAAKEWENYANIKFKFVDNGPAHIRVFLNDRGGWNSAVGSSASLKPEYEQTMNLDTSANGYFGDPVYLRACVIHEFGHALGLLHEHSSPLSGIQWNKEAVYRDHEGIWTKEQVDFNIFSVYNLSYTNGTSYDNKSVMHYPVYAKHTLNGYQVNYNLDFSDGDKQLISALYPRNAGRNKEVARFSVENFSGLQIQNGVEKVAFYPSFDLITKGAPGTVYFLLFFYDEYDQPIMDNDEQFNIGGQVGTYSGATVQPNHVIPVNKTANNLELSIPRSQVGVQEGTNLKVRFVVSLYTPEQEFKTLYRSPEAVSFRFSKP